MADIITIAEYRDYDDLPSPAENDDQIEKAIDAATSFIEKKTGRVIEDSSPSPVDAVDTLDGKGAARIFTRNAPVNAVSKLEYWDGTQWVEYDSTTYPYSFKSGSNIVYFTQGHRFYQGWQNIRVTYTYGYAAVPEDLKYACFLIAKHTVDEADRLGIDKQEDGEQRFWYTTHEVPKEALAIIARYKTVW